MRAELCRVGMADGGLDMAKTNYTLAELVSRIFDCGAIAIRDVDAGEEP